MNRFQEKISDLFDTFDSWVNELATQINRRALVIAIVTLPSVIAIILPALFWGKSILSFFPNSSDEITYWREINTFVNYGFGGGQYSNDELPAPFAGSPFGTHGPAFAVVYGSLGKLFGWQEYSPMLIHIILVAIALFFAIKIIALSTKQLLVLLFLVVTWWPLQLYIPSNMQEILHLSCAILLSALFYKFFTVEEDKVRYSIYILILLIFLIPFKFIWAFLVFPLFLFFPRRIALTSWIGAIAGASVFVAVSAWFVFTFYSPSPWFWTNLFETFRTSAAAGVSEFFHHFLDSLGAFVGISNSLPLVVLVRYQMLGLLLGLGIWQIRLSKSRHKKLRDQSRETWFHLFNLGSVLAFALLFYDILDTRDYRLLISPLLLSVLLLVFSNRLVYVYPVVALNLIFLVSFLSYYPNYRFFNFNQDPLVLQATDGTINSNIEFQHSGNRWCNTISISKYGRFNAFTYPLTTVHSGFGTTTILDWKLFLDRPLQAKYVLLDPDYLLPGFGNPVNRYDLIEISSTPLGSLFVNPYSSCE